MADTVKTDDTLEANADTDTQDNGQGQEEYIPHQLILFGPPGTGKSHKVHGRSADKNELFEVGSYAKVLEIESEDKIFRTVFHPEYTYLNP